MGKPYSNYGSVEKFWSVNVSEETTQAFTLDWVAVLNPVKGKVDLINKCT